MLKEIANKDNLIYHAQMLKKKRFKPGFDGMTAQSAVLWLQINGEQLCRRILRGGYDPMPAAGFCVAKQNGSYRQLAKLSALDMAVQNAILATISPLCQKVFSDYTYAYLPERGVTAALQQYCEFGSKYPYAATVDSSACFDNIDHDILETAVAEFISDPDLVTFIMKYVKMPVVLDGEITYLSKGILQGAPLSNLLCNIYFSKLDRYLECASIPFIRYADDIVLFAADAQEITCYYDQTVTFLEENLALTANSKKCKTASSASLRFLGHRFENGRYGLSAFEETTSVVTSYRRWHGSMPENSHRRVDIVSDGILRQKDFSLLFDTETVDTPIPVLSTDVINIYSSVVLDSRFLQRAMTNNIVINVFDNRDKLIGRFVPNALHSGPWVCHQQLLEYYDENRRLELARGFVLASIHNCRLNIRYYHKQKPNVQYTKALVKINELEKEIKLCKTYETLLMLEASVRESYYGCFDDFVAGKDLRFEKRSKRPPKNEINAMLSFGNVVLYNYIATQIYRSPLDIRIGYLHATNRRPESLNLDVAEVYKPLLVDRTVFSLVNLGSIRLSHFVREKNGGVYLSQEGKRIFLSGFYGKLDTAIAVKGQKMTYAQIISEELRVLTRHFRKGEKYTPFKQVK